VGAGENPLTMPNVGNFTGIFVQEVLAMEIFTTALIKAATMMVVGIVIALAVPKIIQGVLTKGIREILGAVL
jgi:predicted RecA/RadA family phage recombinase